ncbi:alpha/beta fold hydrolase [Paraherbaspirillum soli]|uniref:Alpha/beta fold hydrolase n=1 Tax=Paraherbaspirillum soli TaxID=631222 RepID=A0ABW0M8Z7_9BURK
MIAAASQSTPSGFPYLSEEQKAFSLYRNATIFTEEIVTAEDGTPLTVYRAGDAGKPTAVLINPLGISCLFMSNLARSLAQDYHVLTWESRGLPDYAALDQTHADQWTLERHCRDLIHILKSKDCAADVIVSYCSGANIAIYGLAHGLFDTGKLCMVSPSVEMGKTVQKTVYQKTVLPLWLTIAKGGLRTAAMVRALLKNSEKTYAEPIDHELSVINNLPFQSDELLYRYAQLHAPCLELDCASLLPRLSLPTMVVQGEDDDMIHPDTATAVAAALPHSQLRWINDGGHFAIYKNLALQKQIGEFLAGSPALMST